MKKIRLIVAAIACLLLLQGCIRLQPDDQQTGGEDTAKKEPPVPYYLTATYTYKTEVDPALLCTQKAQKYLVLANKTTTFTDKDIPEDLVVLRSTVTPKSISLDRRAAEALYAMLEEMKADGIELPYVTSAYRSYEYQVTTFNGYVQREMSGFSAEAYELLGEDYILEAYINKGKSGLSKSDAERVALTYSAKAGTSEHQTGLCVDFMTYDMTKLNREFENKPAFAWLSQNCYRFGFILRYPKEKTDITGYSYEPWHYRFVGREAATDIYFGGLTLEEYIG